MRTHKLLWIVVVFAGLMVVSLGCSTVADSSEPVWWSDAYSPQAEEIPAGLKAKTITFYEFEEKFGERTRTPKEKYLVRYDKTKDKTSVDFLSADEKLIRRVIYQHNKKGQALSKYVYHADGSLDERYIYQYDDQGNKSKLVRYDAENTLYYKKSYKYDAKTGQLAEVNYTEYKGVSIISHQYLYKYKDKTTEKAEYDSDGHLIRRMVYEGGPQGNRLKTIWYDGAGQLRRQWNHKYDQMGNRTESVSCRADGSVLERTVCKYGARNNKTEETVYQMKQQHGKLEEIPIRQITYEYQF